MVSKTIQIDDVAQLIQTLHQVPGLIKTKQRCGRNIGNGVWRDFVSLEFESKNVVVSVYKREGALLSIDASDPRFDTADKSSVFWTQVRSVEDIDVDGLAAAIQEADSRNEGDSE